jgi:phosphatidylserine/phosphatidylglycerophosphate/cardiolipin synthase-like enzyme
VTISSLLDLSRFAGKGKSFDPKLNRRMPGIFPSGTSDKFVTLYSPDDDIHGALCALVGSAQHSVVVAMYGFDDDDLARIISQQCKDPRMFVSLSLDSTQAAGKHERAILDLSQYPGSSIAFGQSEEHAIMHLKMVVIDGRWTITGSTNWSVSGETKQDNQLTVIDDPLHAAFARTKIDIIHDVMLQQMSEHDKMERTETHEAYMRSLKKGRT